MKNRINKQLMSLLFLLVLIFSGNASSAEEVAVAAGDTNGTASMVVGATTIDGKNYQQFGIRADIPIGKLGIGLDFQLLFDEDGAVREEDWDEAEDYLDKIYYIRWDKKGAPFYAKIGGLDYSYIGYSNVVNGYSNMVDYPDYKRIGMEMSFKTEKIDGELFLNNLKELDEQHSSVVYAARFAYRVLGKLAIGATIAGDMNEYNGLHDSDGDGYPDEIDEYPFDEDFVTEKEKLLAADVSTTTIDDLAAHNQLKNITRDDLPNYYEMKSDLTIWSLDIGYPIIDGDTFKLDLYSAYTDILEYGWGVSAPGLRGRIGDIFNFSAEYRVQSKEFMFGYINNTYEIERAYFQNNDNGTPDDTSDDTLVVKTRQDKLAEIQESMQGYLVGAGLNFSNFVNLSTQYQNMVDENSKELQSINGQLVLNDGAISAFPTLKGYYVQNNVESFKEWKTESTIIGYILEFNMGNAKMGFNYRYTFNDKNGDGVIKGDDETIKTLSLTSTVAF